MTTSETSASRTGLANRPSRLWTAFTAFSWSLTWPRTSVNAASASAAIEPSAAPPGFKALAASPTSNALLASHGTPISATAPADASRNSRTCHVSTAWRCQSRFARISTPSKATASDRPATTTTGIQTPTGSSKSSPRPL